MIQEPPPPDFNEKLTKSGHLLPKVITSSDENMNVIAFVNPSAGGGQGVKVLHELKSILGNANCYDLKADKGPAKGLNDWKEKSDSTHRLVVIAGGGDGTVGWVLTVIDLIDFQVKPSVVPLALGTANDMSRILRWGKGYTGESLNEFIHKIYNNSVQLQLDRWMVTIKSLSDQEIIDYKANKHTDAESDDEDSKGEDSENEEISTSLPNLGKHRVKQNTSILGSSAPPMRPKQAAPSVRPEIVHNSEISEKENSQTQAPSRPKLAPPTEKPIPIRSEIPETENSVITETEDLKIYVANNYFSIGIDSKMLLEFDQLRKSHPELFPHRMINFGWYGLIGLKSMTERIPSLRHFTTLIVDNKERPIPRGAKALIFMNVPSYCGGTNPWRISRNPEVVPEKVPQSICDGIVEIFAMKGAAHIGRNFAQVSRGGIRICQGKTVTLINTELVAGQVDGEPYWFTPSKFELKCQGQGNLLYCTLGDQDEKKRNRLIGKPPL